jgi:hypothetical protein
LKVRNSALFLAPALALALSLLSSSTGCGGKSGGGSGEPDGSLPSDAASDSSTDLDATTGPDGAPSDGASQDAAQQNDGSTITDGALTDATTDGGIEPDGGPTLTGCIEGTFEVYYGNYHAHTSNSDGEGTPQDAFVHARDVAGLDVMVVTDHLEQLYELWGTDSGEYGDCKDTALLETVAGTFVAMCGFEYGSGFQGLNSTGHNNVFFSPDLFPMVQTDFHDFYNTLVGCADCVGQFNHPGDETTQTWNDFEYFTDVDQKMSLFEFNGAGPAWDLLFAALDMGWHVSPMLNQDNHSADWGTANDHRSGFYLEDLSAASIRQAMLDRRSFMTEDKNASIVLMAESTCWMGSILGGVQTIQLDVTAEDIDAADSFDTIELYGTTQTLLHSCACTGQTTCTCSHQLDVTAATYVVARAVQTDGDILVSAPIWATP